jgi:hypothetical protein
MNAQQFKQLQADYQAARLKYRAVAPLGGRRATLARNKFARLAGRLDRAIRGTCVSSPK